MQRTLCLVLLLTLGLVSCQNTAAPDPADTTLPPQKESTMRLGNFSVSLAVQDIAASRAFYEKLGFKEVGGDQKQNWLVLQNGTTKIGLFQGMFEKNIMTFNPGWDENGKPIEDFEDVRSLQAQLQAAGLTPNPTADPDSTGPAHFALVDPDGNSILIDQHVAKPEED